MSLRRSLRVGTQARDRQATVSRRDRHGFHLQRGIEIVVKVRRMF
jgi:hypothetical protein